MLDTRGAGLSDHFQSVALLEDQIDDILAVMDEVECERAVVLGVSQSGPLATLLAASHPERVSSLILYGTYATAISDDDHPWGRSQEWIESYLERADGEWGTGTDMEMVAPSRQNDRGFRDWWASLERNSNAPGDAIAYIRSHSRDDVRTVLPTLSVPTLVVHRRDDKYRPIALGHYLAERIPGARMVELEGEDHLPYLGDWSSVVAAIEEFITGSHTKHSADRVLATLLFTDIVDSTRTAESLGDLRWGALLSRHNDVMRDEIRRFRGREVNTTGDGFLALFDGPARAIECGMAARDRLADLGIDIRAGVHTGEVEVLGDDVGGIGVHIGARVAAMGRPGEVVVSRTVKDLVAGSQMSFEHRGSHRLKGIADEWDLYSVTMGSAQS